MLMFLSIGQHLDSRSTEKCYETLFNISSLDLKSENAKGWVDSRWIVFLKNVTSNDRKDFPHWAALWSRCAHISGAINDE